MIPGPGLTDVLGPHLRLLLVGINPGRHSVAVGAHYGNPRNSFWFCLHQAGITPRQLHPTEQHLLPTWGVGLTNAALRMTRGSSELRAADFVDARPRLTALVEQTGARWVGFVGKDAARPVLGDRSTALGVHQAMLGPARVFVLPSTSPANAVLRPAQKAEHFKQLWHQVILNP